MTPASAALLLAAIALVIAAYVVACDRIGGGPHDGPWSLGAVLLAGLCMAPSLVDAHASIDPAQAGGACVQAARVAASADAGQRGDGSLPAPPNAPTLRAGQRETRVWQGAPGRLPLAPDAFWRHVAPMAAGSQSRGDGPLSYRGESLRAMTSAAPVLGHDPISEPGESKGNAAQRAHAPATAGPAGVPGGFGSRGAALLDAGPASGESLQGPLAIAAGRHLGCGSSVQERG